MYVILYGENVTALRQEWGMSKKDLAEAAGISRTTARNAERGEPISVPTARSVAAVLRVHPPQRLGQPANRA